MERSQNIDELAAALAAFNLEVENPPADQSATIKHKTGGGQHTITYADLAGITSATRQPLARQGLSVVQEILERNGMIGAATTIMHSSGQWMTFAPVWIPAGDTAKDIGGAVTYSRRYGISPALNLAPEYDGDAPTTSRPRHQVSAPAPDITDEEYAAVELKWRTKGKSDSFIAALLAKGGYTGALKFMPRSAYDFLMRDLDKLPDVADPVSGEITSGTAPAADAEPQALAGESFDGSDEAPGMDAEDSFAAPDTTESSDTPETPQDPPTAPVASETPTDTTPAEPLSTTADRSKLSDAVKAAEWSCAELATHITLTYDGAEGPQALTRAQIAECTAYVKTHSKAVA